MHPSPLEYRGRNLCYNAIKEGAIEFGATIHYMDEQFDTGKIIDVKKFQVELWHTAGDLRELSQKALKAHFLEYIPTFLKGEPVLSLSNSVMRSISSRER